MLIVRCSEKIRSESLCSLLSLRDALQETFLKHFQEKSNSVEPPAFQENFHQFVHGARACGSDRAVVY